MEYIPYTGKYEAKIDPKGRIVIPQSFRNMLGEEFKICLSFDQRCLYVMDNLQYKKSSYKLTKFKLSTEAIIAKRFHAYSFDVKPDKQGRIVIPPQLRNKVHFDIATPVSIVGSGLYVEVWLTSALDDDFDSVSEADTKKMMDNFSFGDDDESVEF